MTQSVRVLIIAAAACVAGGLLITPSAVGHETDQYTLPRRPFADIGPYLNAYFYDAIEGAVSKLNEGITEAQKGNRFTEIRRLQMEGELVRAVNREFPNAMVVIEGLDGKLGEKELRHQFPGQVPGYKESFTNIYEKAHFILDPRQLFRVWLAKTFMAFGVYMGGDKIGHFTDMGMNYWRAYDAAKARGANEEEATQAAISVGTKGLIFSEEGMLGYLSAGAYSNGDMASNYLGFVFYRNLTAPMMLKGRLHAPMVERDGDLWKIADHVKRDNGFFAAFVSDHFDEAINCSHYEPGMRGKIREAIKQRQADVLERFADENGLRRTIGWFATASRDCLTYYGVDYGHRGAVEELNTIARTCFDALPEDASPTDRNDRGYTPLHDAVIRGDLARIGRLLDSGADVNAHIRSDESYSSEWGATALHLAARDGRRDIVEMLLEAGADPRLVDDRGATALHWGAGSSQMPALLKAAGVDVNVRDRSGRTALHWAANLGRSDTADALADSGADPSIADRSGLTPLHLAARRGDPRLIAQLSASGADINATDRFGTTPLHEAMQHDDPEAATLLLNRGADERAADAFGVTALHEAARLGHVAAIAALLDHGAPIDAAMRSGATPLHLAARGGHDAAVTLLLERGAHPNASNAAGVTPLHEAAFSGRPSTVRSLTSSGSDRTAKDARGRTARDIAKARGFKQLVALLQNYDDDQAPASASTM